MKKFLVACRGKYLPYLLLAPVVIYLLAITIYPLISSLILSFSEWSLGTPFDSKEYIGVYNYISILQDPTFWNTLVNTIIYAVGAVGLELVLGMALALLLSNKSIWTKVVRSIVIFPMIITPVVIALIWRLLYNGQFGMINYYISFLGLTPKNWLGDIHLALPAVIAVDVWQWTPFMFLVLLAGVQALPKSPFESAKVDGATPVQMFRYITLPLLKPVILIAVLIRLMDALRMFDKIYVLTFGGPGNATEVLGLLSYRTGFVGTHMGKAAALSYILLIMIIVVGMLLVNKLYSEV